MKMPTRSFEEIMNPPGSVRITQMSDFLKVFCPLAKICPDIGGPIE
jgi:hypothetical protein